MKRSKDRLSRVMIIGATPAGIFAANKLGELEIPVTLVDSEPDLDKKLSDTRYHLKSGMPLNHAHRPGLIRILRNPSIRTILPATVDSIKHNMQGFRVKLTQHQTFLDPEKCTLCGNCITACPVEVNGDKKAIFAHSRQSLPGHPVIDKRNQPLCMEACPLGVNVQGYMALSKEGKYSEAIDLIRERNILPGICGRICTHPCEEQCRRNELDGAVSIRSVKRFLADFHTHTKQTDSKQKSLEISSAATDKKFAIVGSGPAGLAAAWELAKNGAKVTILEKEKMAGGLLRYGIGPHRLPREILDRELEFIKLFNVEIKTKNPVDLTDTGLKKLKKKYDGVIVTTGSWEDRKLGIPGEDLKGVKGCISFLKNYYDGKVQKTKKEVAVIGDGNAAFDLARVLRRTGAKVTLISWFSKEDIPADKEEIDDAIKEGVTIIDNTSVVEFTGKNNQLKGLKCKSTKPGKTPDKNGIIWPEIIKNSPVINLKFEQTFMAIGQTGSLAPSSGKKGFVINAGGYIDTNDHATGIQSVFAAGDAATGPSTVVHAMAQGQNAAKEVLHQICGIKKDIDQRALRPCNKDFDPVSKDTPEQMRVSMPMVSPKSLTQNFTEIATGFSEEQAILEAGRCLQCGSCSECLICMEVCRAKAVNHLEPEDQTIEHTGVLILADPDMIPHTVKGVDIIRAYGPKATIPDIYAMIMRGFASAAKAMTLLKDSSRLQQGHGLYSSTHDSAFGTQEIKIGIFVCKCNDSLGWDESMDNFLESIQDDDPVVHVGTIDSACISEGLSSIIKTVRSKSINRIVLASCVCCPLNLVCTSCTDQRSRLKHGLFTATGISRSMVETCNIRGEALNLLAKDAKQAVKRFKGLLTRSIKRAQNLKPFNTPERNYNFTTGVIGESEASVTSAMMLAETGAEVMMFGSAKKPLENAPEHPNIQAFLGSQVDKMSGTLGDFHITAMMAGKEHTFNVGAVILEDKSLKTIKHIHQEGLPDRTVLTKMQQKDITGRPFILPGMTSISGLFLSNPPGISLSSTQKGAAAAVNVAAIMPRKPRLSKGYIVMVNQQLCRGCGRCIEECPYQAITMSKNTLDGWTASVDETFCKGCGNCIAVCPTNAVDSPYRDQVFLEQGLEEILV
ncbi:MAG: FAD-dependent oxidoreductase [Desulfobacteraceae bacterium]|nr:FAD-dependent oxidoreductase [Desulfobacteraceae bacterium]